ncbi:MAG: AIR carboxylase family protein [Archaeoglobaceae archaeon]|nr:AIR carboxylase family protein [Archaeoglobaceae archaeon]MDW7990142.1 AIR carboxylase family protein [Archaeoglobaceae archaeon]
MRNSEKSKIVESEKVREVLSMRAVILMGSKVDLNFCREIADKLKIFGIESDLRIASAHKTPEHVLEILKSYEDEEVVFVTVAGRSNALSGFVDANTTKPVIASPPIGDKWIDLFSSIRMPSGVAPMLVLEAENVALAVAKIFAIREERIRNAVKEYQKRKKDEILKSDKEVG